ncbi:MAG TPA: farnesyl diphosphate synthase [Pyrinomonadaceae bacterium]|nr:farnesyl diphosphate synthase [Pyrinomonadaceae bacterium]
MNKLKTFFADCTRKVDEKLESLVPSAQIEPKKLHEAVRWSLFAGGKRFRPALLLAVGQTFSVPDDKLLQTAAVIEMIHTYSLVHDDLPAMDNDDLRRGRATCHKKFGEAAAILAGDVLQTLAFQAIAEDKNLSAEIRVKLVSEIARAAGTPSGMVAGQQFDLEAEGKNISIEHLEKIHHSKTGAMIFVAARAGAIVAEASKQEIEIITNYAAKLGLLFQITDDLLDVTQTTEVLGKTAGKDVSAKKATYPAIYGLDKTRKLAENVYFRACRELKKIDKETGLLREIADFILNREK